jgi:NAD(P)-dependent dehydrogenase (short-subunit alcohol dehydrogenase family)
VEQPWVRSAEPGRRLEGRTALVTGAGCAPEHMGVGGAIAILFASQGAQVGILDISAERAENTRRLVEAIGGKGMVTIGDIADPDDNARCVEEVAGALGPPDIVVNSAAVVAGGPSPVSLDVGSWDRVMAINLTGAVLTTGHVVPHMRSAGRGAIVNISSIAATRGFGSGAYSASKAALIAQTRDWAYQYGREGIRANCIVIGHAFTPMGNAGGEHMRERRRRAALIPVEGTAWDVAWAAVFLVSDEARWITGIELTVDGGTTSTSALGLSLLDERSPMT